MPRVPFAKSIPMPDYKPPRRSKHGERYEPVDKVPDGLKWKPQGGPGGKNVTVLLSTPGSFYKLIRDRNTGDVVYFKLKDFGPAVSPAEKIDAEPKRKGQVRYRKGATCWFVDAGSLWYLVEVVDRIGDDRATFGEPHRIVIKSVTGFDAERRTAWAYGDLLEFPAKPDNQMFMRLRPLKDRYQ